MSDDTLTDESSAEGDSLSETIAAALEEHQDEGLIAELGSAQDAAQETQETDGEALPDENGAETPGDEGADQTEAQEEAGTEPERDTGASDAHRQAGEAYQAAVAPYQQYLASKGVEPAQAVRILLAAEHQLSTGTPERKTQIFAKLARDYGIDLSALADMEDAEPANPELTQIQQRIGGIERLINGERQQIAAQVQQDAEAQVAAFEKEKDTAGNPLRPHLTKVSAAMGRFMEEDPNLTLKDAYNNAIWADPKLRKAALADHRTAPASKHSKPGKAKKAKPAKEPSLRDDLLQAHRAAMEGIST